MKKSSKTGILSQLKPKGTPTNLEGIARFDMTAENRLMVSVPDIRRIAKDTGRDHKLAAELWKTEIAEAKIVASMIAVPGEISGKSQSKP